MYRSNPFLRRTDMADIMLDPSAYRDCQITYADWSLWAREIIMALIGPDDEV